MQSCSRLFGLHGQIILLSFAFTLLTPPPISAQNVTIKSISQLEFDTTALRGDVRDNNGERCALLKVRTTERGFTFDVGKIGVNMVEPQTRNGSHDAEIWVWIPSNARKLTIQHPELGLVRDFDIVGANGAPLEPGGTYEVKLETGHVNSLTVSDYSKTQKLNLSITPSDATVFINNIPQSLRNGRLSIDLPIGDVLVVASKPMYESVRRTVRLSDEKPETVNLVLMENYGWLSLTENEEYKGAEVKIDGKIVGTMPLTPIQLEAGLHEIEISKSQYIPFTKRINLARNQSYEVEAFLEATFANINITTPDKDAEIWLNGDYKGRGVWSGRLDPGVYVAETRKNAHYTQIREFRVDRSRAATIEVASPTPIMIAPEVAVQRVDPDTLNEKLEGDTTTFKSSYDNLKVSEEPNLELSFPKRRNYELSIGPRIGGGLALVREEKGLDFTKGIGYGFSSGVEANIRLGGKNSRTVNGCGLFGVGLEFNYAFRSIGTQGDAKLNLSKFEIPVMLQIYPLYKSSLRNLFIEAGPTFSKILSSSPETISTGYVSYNTGSLKRMDIKLTVGVGYRVNRNSPNSGFYISLRYNHGFSNLAGNLPVKINNAEITLGYLFKCAGGAKVNTRP